MHHTKYSLVFFAVSVQLPSLGLWLHPQAPVKAKLTPCGIQAIFITVRASSNRLEINWTFQH
jgi:hypothetical protein